MHELALADAVIKAALRAADEAGMDRIDKLVVKVGELQQIEKDLFEFSLTSVLPTQDERIADAEFEVTEERVRFGCKACGHEYAKDEAALDGGATRTRQSISSPSYPTRLPAARRVAARTSRSSPGEA